MMNAKKVKTESQVEIPKAIRSWQEFGAIAKFPLLVSVIAFLLVLMTLDTNGGWGAKTLQAPGVTIDESFNLQQGVVLVETLKDYNLALLYPESIKQAFGDQSPYLSDHPPLGRLVLGISQSLFGGVFKNSNPQTQLFSLPAARVGSAIVYATMIFLVGFSTTSWFGKKAGLIAAISIVIMPRLFAHAHFASLESCLNLAYVASVLMVARYWSGDRPPQLTVAAGTGILLGITLLTKIQGVFLPFPLAIVALIHFRQKAILPILVWGIAGVAVFFVCWQWLWLDPWNHTMQYLGRATERVTLHTWYFGERFEDKQTPWHFPWIMFLTTIPIGLLAMSGLAMFQKIIPFWSQRKIHILLANALFPLILFSLPVATYDGSRLFLMAFPLWAIIIGIGGATFWEWCALRWSAQKANIILVTILLLQCWGLVRMHPCQLAYHNLLIGGRAGADAVGMERDYWASSLTQDFLERAFTEIPPNSTVSLFPTLHQFQRNDFVNENKIVQNAIQKSNLQIVEWTEGKTDADYLILYQRLADIPASVKKRLQDKTAIVSLSREGVPLATLYRLKPEKL